MRFCFSAAVLLLLVAGVVRAGESLPRVAILPLTAQSDRYLDKQDGDAVSTYIQGQLRDFPGVEWVERGDLDRLLGETELEIAAAGNGSDLVKGRLLKADLIIHGQYSEPQWEKDEAGNRVYRRHLLIQVTDLTNAAVLASADLPLNSLAQESSDLNPEILNQCADTARRLLSASLEARRKTAGSIALAPLFFANSGASSRLDNWGDLLLDRFAEVSASFPGTTVLRFRGLGEASREQGLSLLGLTDADPNVWQAAADGYIWGSYHEIAPAKTTAFEDIQVEAELFLMMRGKTPEPFVRTFAVKDFQKVSRGLAAQILQQAVATKGEAPPTAASGAQASALIFQHVCEFLNGGSALVNLSKVDLILRAVNAVQFDARARTNVLFGPHLVAWPSGERKLEYARHLLEVACFFDPENARLQLLRILTGTTPFWPPPGGPDDQLASLAACETQLKRLVQDPDYDPTLFTSAVNQILNQGVTLSGYPFGFQPWHTFHITGPGSWTMQSIVPPGLTAERDAILSDFYPLLIEQTPLFIRRMDRIDKSRDTRKDVAGWLGTFLQAKIDPETKFKYFETVWPLLAGRPGLQLDRQIDQLIKDLGDRGRVQAVLMGASAAKTTPVATPGPGGNPFFHRPAFPTQEALTAWFKEPLLAAISPVMAPPARTIAIPWSHLARAAPDPGKSPFVQDQQIRMMLPMLGGNAELVYGFGDKLLVEYSLGPHGSPLNAPGGMPWFQYRMSTGQFEPVRPSRVNSLSLDPSGRMIYSSDGTVGCFDLLSENTVEFSASQGLPTEMPSLVGYAGSRFTVVAGNRKRTAGIHDWTTQKWLTPPSPPAAVPTPTPHYDFQHPPAPWQWAVSPIVGTEGMAVFPGWNLLFDLGDQTWKTIPALPDLSGSSPVPPYIGPGPNAGTLVLDGDIWRWDSRGILDYSPAQGRILWQTETHRLCAVAVDGPYLWLLFGNSTAFPIAPVSRQGSSLLLLERATHRNLGAISLPGPAASLYIGEHEFYIAGRDLQYWDKADIYGALDVACPSPAKETAPYRAAEPAGPISLYDSILRGDLGTVKRLLARPGAADTLLGQSKTPALTVAVWTRNLDLVKLFLDGHPGALNTAPAEIPNAARLLPNNIPIGPPDATPFSGTPLATPLVAAARQRDPRMTRLLLDAGAVPTNAALLEALSNRNFDVAGLLLKAGAPAAGIVDIALAQPKAAHVGWPAGPFSALDIPGAQKDTAIAAWLAASGAPLSAVDRSRLQQFLHPGNATLDPALAGDASQVREFIKSAIAEKNEDQAVALMRYIPPGDASAGATRGLFIQALESGMVKLAEAFLRDGASPDPAAPTPDDPVPEAPLMVALGHPESVLLLLRYGAHPRLLDSEDSLFIEGAAGSSSGPDILPAIVKYYPDLNTRIGYGTIGGTALCAAVARWREGTPIYMLFGSSDVRESAVRELLAQGVPAKASGREGRTALHLAFAWRDAGMACMLAGYGADILSPDLSGRTVLDPPYLSVGGDLGFQEALEKYKPASDVEKLGQTRLLDAIHNRPTLADLRGAVMSRDLGKVNNLLSHGAALAPPFEQYTSGEAGKPGLVFLAVTERDRELVQSLLAHGCDPNIGELGVVAWSGDRWRWEKPLYSGDDSGAGDPKPAALGNCKTPLIAAAELGDLEMVRMLLDAGAYALAQDQFHRNAIDAAATPDIARYIEDHTQAQVQARKLFEILDANPSLREADLPAIKSVAKIAPEAFFVRNAQGSTPFNILIGNKFGGIVADAGPDCPNGQALIIMHKCGIKFTQLDDFGMTPLHHLVLHPRADEAINLIKVGFDPTFPDSRGITALDLAQTIVDDRERTEVVNALNAEKEKSPYGY